MSAIVPTSLIGQIFERAINQGDLTAIDELVAPESETHGLGWGVPADRMGLKQWVATLRTAFPDLLCTIEDEFSQGDRVAARWNLRGTHRGPFLGNKPTLRPVVVHGLVYARVKEDRVIENWTILDQWAVLQQLGLVPPPLRRQSS